MEIYKEFHVESEVLTGLAHHIRNIPAWVQSVRKDGLRKQKIDRNYFLAPALFLLAPHNQKIIRADYATDLYDHESFTKIYDSIAEYEIHGL